MKNLILTGEISSPDVVSTIVLLDKDLNVLTKDSFSLIKTNSFEYSYEVVKSVDDAVNDTLYFLRINDEIFKCSPVSYNSRNTFSFNQGTLPLNVSDKTWIQKSPVLFKKGTAEVYSPIFLNEIDPYYLSVVLFLPMTSDFNDYSKTPKTIYVSGNTSLSSTKSKWGSKSAYFDGSGDYLTPSVSSDLNFGGSIVIFTIECWINFSNSGTGHVFGNWTNGTLSYMLWCYSGGAGFSYSTNGAWQPANDYYPITISLNAWHHIAIVRISDGSIFSFVDGVKTILKGANSDVFYSTTSTTIGGNNNNQYLTGYLQDLRITKGVARYTTNFTPPSRIIYNNLTYSENLSQQIVLDNQFVTEWFNYSSASISASESLNIGSGILLSAVLKKKDSTPINCTFISKTSEYLIEIMNDVFYINNTVTTLIISEQFQLFSIWLNYNSSFKTWLDNTPKTIFTSSTTISPTSNSLSKQFIGYESFFGIFNTPEPSLETITYLLESSNIKGTFKIIGQFYINNTLMSDKELILLDKNYYKIEMTITDVNGNYSFNDLFYDSYYIASKEDNVQNIILGPTFPIAQ